jgi:hypothetical protein
MKPEQNAKPWDVNQACYASLLSEAGLDWLISGEMIEH